MPRKKTIQLVLCWMVATLLLAVYTAGGTHSRSAVTVSTIAAGQEDEAQPTGETTVQELQFNAVVISVATFAFSQDWILAAPSLLPLRSSSLSSDRFEIPYFFFSYFHKVFGNYIVANAP